MSLHLRPAERGTISSIELDGSRFRVVREGLHGLSLFTVGEGFLLWSTTSTNSESILPCFVQLLLLHQDTGLSASPCGVQAAPAQAEGQVGGPHLPPQAPLWEEVEQC